jgi:uncharacterized membrane protein YgdD (TMEM256/DUF423 family)
MPQQDRADRGRPRAAFLLLDAPYLVALGGIAGLLAVAGGAFGAHGLRDVLEPARLQLFRTGIEYQMYHALALGVLGALQHGAGANPWFARAGSCFAGGIVLFSGSLYALALGAPRLVGVITPAGGLLFLLGWACVIAGALRRGR